MINLEPFERHIFELSDAGQQPNEIAADLKLPRRAVQNLVRSLNWSMAEDRLTAAALERGSTQLAAAVIAAGGHR
ncbi:MAG: hypothetical protein JKX86_02410 [Verrucomicrobiales bacterium]|nr:hypothetical protein [Verrucomicrobiales bacterium]